MNIEEFYDQDERRRASEELELGDSWHDASGNRYELNYVVDTGELYLMAAPDAKMVEDPFGDIAVSAEPVEALGVEVLAVVPAVDELHRVLAGWEGAMRAPSSVAWLRAKIADLGAA